MHNKWNSANVDQVLLRKGRNICCTREGSVIRNDHLVMSDIADGVGSGGASAPPGAGNGGAFSSPGRARWLAPLKGRPSLGYGGHDYRGRGLNYRSTPSPFRTGHIS